MLQDPMAVRRSKDTSLSRSKMSDQTKDDKTLREEFDAASQYVESVIDSVGKTATGAIGWLRDFVKDIAEAVEQDDEPSAPDSPTGVPDGDILHVNINALSGYLDACLDELGRSEDVDLTQVSIIDCLRAAQGDLSPVTVSDEREDIAKDIESLLDERNSKSFNAALRLAAVRVRHPHANQTEWIGLIARAYEGQS
jgi:hypothetical protein